MENVDPERKYLQKTNQKQTKPIQTKPNQTKMINS